MTIGDSQQPHRGSIKNLAFRSTTWLLAIGCFYLVYGRIEQAALREHATPLEYLGHFFGEADWIVWMAIMVPYSIFFFLVDTHATWRVIRWFNAPAIRFVDILPIRASAYILSLVNEQIGKGAMSLYLLQRHQVPGWKAVSSMILLGMVEIYQLLLFSALGVWIYIDLVRQASIHLPCRRSSGGSTSSRQSTFPCTCCISPGAFSRRLNSAMSRCWMHYARRG